MRLTHSNYDFEAPYTFDAKHEAKQVQSEIDDIEALLDSPNEADHKTATEDLAQLRELLEGLEEIGEEQAILACDFEKYARELHEDINGDGATGWPYDYIDWERAADALRSDYAEVDLDGVTYCYRA